MKIDEVFKRKHELWLTILFGSFCVRDEEVSDILYDFAMIEYRHLGWLGGVCRDSGVEIDFEKDDIDIRAKDSFELFEKLVSSLKNIGESYPVDSNAMFFRFKSDEEYFLRKLDRFLCDPKKREKITAFDKNRKLDSFDLDREQTDALTLFLFEESYKEYELILVYTYANFFTDSKLLSNIFIDLIYESFFHLKSFAKMMSKMGILTVPRTVVESVYRFDDLQKFLNDGIKEEEGAKEECLRLAKAVNNKELSDFFLFINNQEDYHIELMKKALEHIKEKQ